MARGLTYAWVASEQDRRRAFARWFRGSHVMDLHGDPLPVYHCATKLCDSFVVALDARLRPGETRSTMFFTAKTRAAEILRLGLVRGAVEGSPVYLRIMNPARAYYGGPTARNPAALADLIQLARAEGRDGMIISARKGSGAFTSLLGLGGEQRELVYAIFEPDQIKSARDREGWKATVPTAIERSAGDGEEFRRSAFPGAR